MPRQTPRYAGFTIIELMVAISIMTLLMFLVHQLFNETSRAVSTGMKSGTIFVESETFGDQLERDAERMLGPDSDADFSSNDPTAHGVPAGFLVIVNRQIPDAPVMYQGYELFEDTNTGDRAIRSDMLIFVTGPTEEEVGDFPPTPSVTPRNASQFGSDLEAQYTRVIYGHAQRTATKGSRGTPLGDPGDNRRASSWILSRHQLLLAPDELDTDNDIYANYATWGANIQGYSDTGPIGTPRMYDGLTDVTAEPLAGDPATLPDMDSSIIYQLNAGSGDYPARIAPLYRDSGGNVTPISVNPSPTDMEFDSWRIAQMHGQLTGNVSDFIVEFAGDYQDGDGQIDRDGEGNIIWYTTNGLANDGSNAHIPRTEGLTGQGSAPNEFYFDEWDGTDTNGAFIWRHDDGEENSQWPYLIRVRYRVHDSRGLVESTVGEGVPEVGRWFEHVIRVRREP